MIPEKGITMCKYSCAFSTLLVLLYGSGSNLTDLWNNGGGINDPSGNKSKQELPEVIHNGSFRSASVDNWQTEAFDAVSVYGMNIFGDIFWETEFNVTGLPFKLEKWLLGDYITRSSADNSVTQNAILNNNRYQLRLSSSTYKSSWFAVLASSVVSERFILVPRSIYKPFSYTLLLEESRFFGYVDSKLLKRTTCNDVNTTIQIDIIDICESCSSPAFITSIIVNVTGSPVPMYTVWYNELNCSEAAGNMKVLTNPRHGPMAFQANGSVANVDILMVRCIEVVLSEAVSDAIVELWGPDEMSKYVKVPALVIRGKHFTQAHTISTTTTPSTTSGATISTTTIPSTAKASTVTSTSAPSTTTSAHLPTSTSTTAAPTISTIATPSTTSSTTKTPSTTSSGTTAPSTTSGATTTMPTTTSTATTSTVTSTSAPSTTTTTASSISTISSTSSTSSSPTITTSSAASSISATTSPGTTTYSAFHCPCNETLQQLNLTKAELQERIAEIQRLLAVNVSLLSATTRKLTSAKDSRVSAVSIGYVGVGILVSIFAAIVFIDAPMLLRDFKKLFHNIKNGLCPRSRDSKQ